MTKRAALLYPDRKISETFLEFAGRLVRDLPSEAPHGRLSTRGRLHSDREIMGHHCESRGLSPLFVSPQVLLCDSILSSRAVFATAQRHSWATGSWSLTPVGVRRYSVFGGTTG